MWNSYSLRKQTQKEIGKDIKRSRQWVNKKFKSFDFELNKNPNIDPQETVLIIDTTYFKDFGLMVFRSWNKRRNLLYFKVNHETNDLYEKGVKELANNGWKILAIVADGRPGLRKRFTNIPFQFCNFHQVQIVTRYISKKPKLEAAKELKKIVLRLKETDYVSFEYWLSKWYEKWKSFLDEKSENLTTGEKHFTHRRLRSAYFSIKRNLPYLFTFEKHPEFNIPNTTNSLDGYFSHLKDKLRVHRGASKETQLKIISSLIFR